MWQKWQKDNIIFYLCFLPSCGKSGKIYNLLIINMIFATFAIMWQKWQNDECYYICHFCHHVAKVAKRMNYEL